MAKPLTDIERMVLSHLMPNELVKGRSFEFHPAYEVEGKAAVKRLRSRRWISSHPLYRGVYTLTPTGLAALTEGQKP